MRRMFAARHIWAMRRTLATIASVAVRCRLATRTIWLALCTWMMRVASAHLLAHGLVASQSSAVPLMLLAAL